MVNGWPVIPEPASASAVILALKSQQKWWLPLQAVAGFVNSLTLARAGSTKQCVDAASTANPFKTSSSAYLRICMNSTDNFDRQVPPR